MNDLIIYFGLLDFVLLLLPTLVVVGAVGWWLGRRRHKDSPVSTLALVKALPNGIIIARASSAELPTVVAANAEAEQLWGEPLLAQLDGPLSRLVGDAKTHPGYHVSTLDTPSGSKLQVSSVSLDEPYTLLILEDLTARKQQESFYRNFIHNVSHELKTPLTVIQGHIAALSDRMLNEDARQTSQRIAAQEAIRLTHLVDNLLLLSRLEMPDFNFERRLVNLEAVVEDAILQLSDLAEERNITIGLKCEHPLPRLMADRDRLKQVLINLLDNGIKYNREGGKVTVDIHTDEHDVMIKVADTGEGIPLQDQAHIFEKLYRVDRRNGRYVEGSGLGLSIVQYIVDKHGGHIAVESEVNVGTTFTLSLPRVDESAQPER
ncbi:MAG: GHKL domain-containing protein [Anaerolineae bacterium]|nr:GHKL domain-containing protein [Anaerolineae bacterium]